MFFEKAVREVVWNVENLRNLVERNQGKEVDGESVENGDIVLGIIVVTRL